MIEPLVVTSASAAIYTAIGLPAALLRPSSRRSLSALLFDSLSFGLLLGTCLIAMWIWFGLLGSVSLAAIVGSALVVVARRRDGERVLADLPRPSMRWWGITIACIVGVSFVLRMRSVNFLPWAGDMGDYVNAANGLVRSGVLDISFPPAFPSFLAVPAFIFGPSGTTASVPLLGMVLIGATLRVLGQVRAHPTVRVAATLLLGLSPMAVWFSSFPVSEAMQAPLLVLLISSLLAAIPGSSGASDLWDGRATDLLFVALAALTIGFSRGSSFLFLIPLVVLVVVFLGPALRARIVAVGDAAAAMSAGLALGYWYGVVRIPTYFVDAQIGRLLPTPLFRVGEKLGLFRPSIQLVVALLAVTAAPPVIARLLDRRWPDRGSDGSERTAVLARWWPVPLTGLAAIASAAVLIGEGPGEVHSQVGRMGIGLLLIAALASLIPRAVRGDRAVVAVFASVTALLMLVIHASRFDGVRPHVHYLYWDRYIFSEVFPVTVLLAALASTAVVEAVRQRTQNGLPGSFARRYARPAAGVVVVVLASLHVTGSLDTLRLVTARTLLDGAQRLDDRLVQLMPDESVPILWSAQPEAAEPNPLFPNTWFAFGFPLERSYGRNVVNLDRSQRPFDLDEPIRASAVRKALACSSEQSVYVVEFENEGTLLSERLATNDLEITRLGSVTETIPMLKQLENTKWEEFDLSASVWSVSGEQADLPRCCVLPGC